VPEKGCGGDRYPSEDVEKNEEECLSICTFFLLYPDALMMFIFSGLD